MSDAGSLSEVPGSPFATAINQPVALAVHPDGDAIYVGCNGGGTGTVEAFSIEATTGALISLGSQVVSSGGVRDVVVEPRGGFVYSINATNSIHRFAVNADKTLGLSTAFTVDSSTNAAPARLVVDPSGAFLYVTGQATDQIYSFDLNATTGALTTLEVVPTGGTGASLAGLAVASPVLPAWGYGVGPQLESISLEEEVGLLTAMECELAAPGVFSNGLTLDIRRFLRDWFSATTSVATVSTVGRVTGVSTGSVDLSAVEKVTGTRPLLTATVVDHINLRGSTTTAGDEPDDESDWPALSSDGRFLVFISLATDLTGGVGNDAYDVYLYDFKTNTNQRISLDTGGGDPNGDSDVPVISGDGRYIVYESDASDLVSGDANGEQDIFLYDRVNQTTRRITVNTSGGDADGRSSDARITPDGRYVTFESEATNLVSGDGNGFQDCFVYDRLNDTIERVSVADGGGDSDGRSTNSDISEDGNLVVFDSEATNLLSTTDGNALKDIFLYNRTTGVTTRISEASGGGDPDGLSNHPRISKDGAFVAFESEATNLVSGDTNAVTDIYLVEVASGTTTRVSLSDAGVEPDSDCLNPNVSSDGGLVAFETDATTLVTGATGDCIPYLYDRTAGTLSQAVFSAAGGFPEDNTFCSTLSYDGRFLAFVSFANNLRAGDSGQLNVYMTPLRCLP